MKPLRLAAASLVALPLALAAGGDDTITPANQKLKEALEDNALVGPWVYNDLEEGLKQARKTGKPLLLVYRCVT